MVEHGYVTMGYDVDEGMAVVGGIDVVEGTVMGEDVVVVVRGAVENVEGLYVAELVCSVVVVASADALNVTQCVSSGSGAGLDFMS